MTYILYLFAAYGLCFGFQNKLPFLYSDAYKEEGDPKTFLDRLLHCTYCTGFHCGWMVYLAQMILNGTEEHPIWQYVLTAVVWSFASAAFCYGVDAGVKWLEDID